LGISQGVHADIFTPIYSHQFYAIDVNMGFES
jgi:hypothetical protein